ncbi:MAG TPA: zinc ribbon domain-containing protein [Dehalococcoidia bacterium]|nr:zinc ribbon domain-containing protein [Dehalococcoidia bacterium]HIN23142.1 zinc ribbon domain-containing protein [Dehalococcoidia bacterium]
MPRYDYRCESCKDEFELVQSFAEAGKGACPACGGAGQRVYHAVPVIYKGSGFYTTDYGRPKQPSESKNGSSDSSSDSKSSDDSKSTADSKSSGDSKSDTAAKSTSDSSSKSSTESSSSSTSTTASSS